MAHEILKSIGKVAAWHRLNEVFPDGLTAEEGLQVIKCFDVKKVKPFVNDPFSDSHFETEYSFVVREPVADWNETKGIMFNRVVNDRYEIITPRMAVDAWMEAVKQPNGQPVKVDAMGYLGQGERMWITAEFDEFFVQSRTGGGTPVKNYCLFYNPLSPDAAAYVRHTPVMVVCANTASMAERHNQLTIEIPHYEGAYDRLVAGLKGVWQGTIQAIDESKTIAQKLVATDLPEQAFEEIVHAIFKTRKAPNPNRVCKTDYQQRIAAWEWHVSFVKAQREKCMELYRGSAMGIQDGFEGTAFGGMMALTEYATHYTNTKDAADNFQKFAEGENYRIVEQAKVRLLELA
jgi:hypothetical protein